MAEKMRVVKRKVCLLGDFAVGKTSLIRRYVEGTFDEKYLSTIGVNISRKSITRPDYRLEFILWDLAGGDEFSGVNANYLRGSAAGIVVCDLTRKESFDNLSNYVQLMRDINPKVVVAAAANKADLGEEVQLSDLEMKTFSKNHQLPWVKTSAKLGTQVDELFYLIAAALESADE